MSQHRDPSVDQEPFVGARRLAPLVVSGIIALSVVSVAIEVIVTAFRDGGADGQVGLVTLAVAAAAMVALTVLQVSRLRTWSTARAWLCTAGVAVLAVAVVMGTAAVGG